MANRGTHQYIQDEVHALFEQDRNTPSVGGDQWMLRAGYINRAIQEWAEVDDVQWRQLWSILSAGSPGAPGRLTVAGQSGYNAPTDFASDAGFVWVQDAGGSISYTKVVPVDKVQLFQEQGSQAEYAYFTGNPNDIAGANRVALQLYPVPTAATAGRTIFYPYYKKPTEFTIDGGASEVTECPNPDFLIWKTLAIMYDAQYDLTRANNADVKAQDILQAMQTRENITPPFQEDSMPQDLIAESGDGFGA